MADHPHVAVTRQDRVGTRPEDADVTLAITVVKGGVGQTFQTGLIRPSTADVQRALRTLSARAEAWATTA